MYSSIKTVLILPTGYFWWTTKHCPCKFAAKNWNCVWWQECNKQNRVW